MNWVKKWPVDFNAGTTQLVLSDPSYNTDAIDVKMDGSAVKEKYLLRCWGWLSLLNWIGALTLSLLLKLSQRKLELYLYKSTILLCMEHCCHICGGALSCYWELLDKLQKRICKIVFPSLSASLETFVHHQNVGSFSLFCRYYFGRCYLNWPNWFHFLILKVGLFVILIDCMIFLSLFLDVRRMSMSKFSFLSQLDPRILCL